MIYNKGEWDKLPRQCQTCENMQVFSVHMNGNHYYSCARYPLTDKSERCPRRIPKKGEGNETD